MTDVWGLVLTAALKLPKVRVDRASFLRASLGRHVSASDVERAIQTTPAKAGIHPEVIRLEARSSIRWHRAGVTAISTLTGLPGGPLIAGAIPADLAQYFWHALQVAQKLAYLHGWPELLQSEDEVDDETKLILTLFVGVMLGAQGAAEGVSKLAAALAKQLTKQLPKAALTKYALYRIAKEVAKWLGVSLTKKKFAEWVGRAVPLVGGLVAGSITWTIFGTSTKRLLEHLEGLPLARPDEGNTASAP